MSGDEQDEYIIPLQDQRVWGAGIKRKRVTFVPAGASEEVAPRPAPTQSAASKYLSVVFKKEANVTSSDVASPALEEDLTTAQPRQLQNAVPSEPGPETVSICPICKVPLHQDSGYIDDSQADAGNDEARKLSHHESSIAHQLCLSHVHPPSAVDRSRKGARYLASYGWDPDARLGLGAQGEGVLVPVKAKVKNNTIGLGVETVQTTKKTQKQSQTTHERGQGKDFKLNAGQIKKRAAEDKKHTERLRSLIFGDDKLSKYLGEDA